MKALTHCGLSADQVRQMTAGMVMPTPEQVKRTQRRVEITTKRRAKSMREQGFKVRYIAELLGISTGAVFKFSRQ